MRNSRRILLHLCGRICIRICTRVWRIFIHWLSFSVVSVWLWLWVLWVSDATFDFVAWITSSLQARCFLLCCRDNNACNKRTSFPSPSSQKLRLSYLSPHGNKDTETNAPVHISRHTKKVVANTHTHLLCSCSYESKQQHKLHYCNTRDHPVTGLYDQLSHAVIPILQNRSLYWDIHQSHHCGLPDATKALQVTIFIGFCNDKNAFAMRPVWSAQKPQRFMCQHINCVQNQNPAVVLVFLKTKKKLVSFES